MDLTVVLEHRFLRTPDGATWTAKRPTRLAVAALGYADGLIRAGSGTDRGGGTGRPGSVRLLARDACSPV